LKEKMIPEDRQDDNNDRSLKLAADEKVEVQMSPAVTRRGIIEAVMKDKSGFWLAADGVEPRVFVHLGEDSQSIRLLPSPGDVT
jgi:hypothetical protein